MIITIDGPTASGKSTIARMLAQELHYYYVCSGLLYRSLAYILVNHFGYTEDTVTHVDPKDIAACFDPEKFQYLYDAQNRERIMFDNEDITPYLKDSFIDRITSITSVNEYVRHFVTLLQHAIAADHNIVIDGRDTGSVVFPHADIKFFLTASIEVRAQRWLHDQMGHNHHYVLQQAIEKIADRDRRDTERAVAPLIIPDDAIIVDNSDLTLEQTFDTMMAHIRIVLENVSK